MVCPNCHKSDLEENDLFCSACGADLKSYLKVQKYNTDKIALVAQIQQSSTNSLVLSPATINEYQNLSREIHDLQDIPQKLSLSTQQLQFMENKHAQDINILNNLKIEQEKNKHDLEQLQKVSVASVIARVKGDKEEKIKKEGEESLSLINRIEGLEKQVSTQQNDITSLAKHIADLKNLNLRLTQNKEALVKLIYQTTNGVPDPTENKLEKDLQNQIKMLNPLQAQLNNKQRVLNCLKSAYTDLDNAYNQLQGASSNNNWDMFMGGGMILDSIKHSQMSGARDAVNRAHQNIDMARSLDPQLPGIDAFVQDFSLFFNIMFDNIFTDWNIQNKINNSLNSVANSLSELDNTISKVQLDIDRVYKEFSSIDSHIAGIREDLLKQRTRMIEDAITRQQVS